MFIQIVAVVLAIVAGCLYYRLLAKASQNNKRFFKTVLSAAIILIAVNTAVASYTLWTASEGARSAWSALVLGFLHSLEMFVFVPHMLDNGYYGPLFNGSALGAWSLYALAVTFTLGAITSISLIIKAFNRRRAGREWLAARSGKTAGAHIFFTGGDAANVLAADIKATRPSDPVIFVGWPDPAENYIDLSLWEKLKRLFNTRSEEDSGPFDAVVYSRIPLSQASGSGVCKQLGLKDLDEFLKDTSCKVYILSQDEDENMRSTEVLYRSGCKATIYCRGRRAGIQRMYEDAMTNTPSAIVHIVDPAVLAVRSVRSRAGLLPVQYVQKGTGPDGLQEGWVGSPFNALVVGFGQTGREALGFLYEQGAFVGKDFSKSPFHCTVAAPGPFEDYRRSFPGLNEAAGVEYVGCEAGSDLFWQMAERLMPSLNYIVIALGDDSRNLKTAVDLVEYAYRSGKDLSMDFVFLIQQENPTRLDEVTLQHYNSVGQYHGCIKTFGSLRDIWTFDNITGANLTARAKKYFAGYHKAQGMSEEEAIAAWDAREDEIRNTTDYARHSKLVRQRSQDYSDCFSVDTKYALIGPEQLGRRKEIAESIPPSFKTTHYTGTDKHTETLLHYLAVQEHLRWEASHVALGYTPGDVTDEIKKTHACIVNYEDLDPVMKHYDYLVVKTTLAAD
ncbi:MAG: hypothetical protein J5759_01505 [Bacteroidales bacterium]|nr:hypothetical protein [Bacteroidales bacterium]